MGLSESANWRCDDGPETTPEGELTLTSNDPFQATDEATPSIMPENTEVEHGLQSVVPVLGSLASLYAPQPSSTGTLIIFDWDDTLMCSSAINANLFMQHQIPLLEMQLHTALTTAMQLGETLIITNADELWVTESARQFAPSVLPLLSSIKIMSARRRYEQAWPADVFAWKRECFREVLLTKWSQQGSWSGLNLVVVGDSPSEMEAAQVARSYFPPSLVVKTVKFKESPSVDELLDQLQFLAKELSRIVASKDSLCWDLVHMLLPQQTLYTTPQAFACKIQAANPYWNSHPSSYLASVGTYVAQPMV